MSNTQVETVRSGADKAKAILVAGLIVAGLVAYYLLAPMGGMFQWAGLIGPLILAALVFVWSEPGRRMVGFGIDSWREVKKVVWPSRKEAIQTTVFVFIFSVVLAFFLWGADKTIEWIMYDLLLGWRK